VTVETLVVPHRFRGPVTSGNGGWTSGALALHLAGASTVRVRLSAPPPLDTPMELAADGNGVVASADGRRVAEAVAVDGTGPEPVPPVPFEAALAAGLRYAGLRDHPFPECFACGPARAADDGLRLQPGPLAPAVPGVDVAAAWSPGPADGDDGDGGGGVPVPMLWAALDCPGGWSVDIVGRPMVLGTMTARVLARPTVGERCVVTGRALQVDDRKALTATSLYGESGDLLATAAHVWVAVDPSTFGRPA
jgi:hypothetical protein